MTARWAAERERASNAPVSLDALRAGAGNASSSSLRANHSFLSNTLHAVGGHNRRVEEGVCWNTKRLIDAVPRGGRGTVDAEAEAAAARARKKRVASFQFEHGHYEVDDAASAGAAGSRGAAGLSMARLVAPSSRRRAALRTLHMVT